MENSPRTTMAVLGCCTGGVPGYPRRGVLGPDPTLGGTSRVKPRQSTRSGIFSAQEQGRVCNLRVWPSACHAAPRRPMARRIPIPYPPPKKKSATFHSPPAQHSAPIRRLAHSRTPSSNQEPIMLREFWVLQSKASSVLFSLYLPS